jgi:hypothetical protein
MKRHFARIFSRLIKPRIKITITRDGPSQSNWHLRIAVVCKDRGCGQSGVGGLGVDVHGEDIGVGAGGCEEEGGSVAGRQG